ncbi:hypothetical protein MMYC01_208260 [Madurella mycetomatis]|uniref:Uncharacterized protein n=1 Tax=Madurella mycetomatis TaxID=100816 RepID=A0A175VXH0_9PEZI|nr:hypothetical protein MMYC01_208260 [Madurella mycetomatis]
MGHSSKFIFPLPGRKQKPAAPAHPPSISGPLTKVQKILGTAEVDEESRAAPADSRWAWEHQSNSGISVAVSEATADHTNGGGGLASGHDGWATAQRERRWEDESDIIPSVLHRQTLTGSMVHDMTTDASSLRRRQSSSTITSFYDKSKLPLSISQQTSNSAMAKGLPSKAHALLDFDSEFSNEPRSLKKKKPSRLDLSSLLQKHKSSKLLHPESHKGHVLGSDMLTKSPSVMSVSPAATPPPIPQRTDRSQSRSNPSSGRGGPAVSEKPQPTRANIDLYNLYDHYEQRTFADAMDQELHEGADYRFGQTAPDQQHPAYPTPPASNSGKTYLSPFPPNASRAGHSSKQAPAAANLTEATLKGAANLSSPASTTPADCASVSSRHTRTSKASKRTDRSLTDIDLLQNSVLALSSDSEDDYELSSKGSLAVPPLSDGQPSPTSPRSAASQRAEPQEGSRNKPAKRTSFAESPQFFPAEEVAAAKGPQIGARSSSLNSKSSAKQIEDVGRQTSRLSIGTTSTDRTVSRVSSQNSGRQRVAVSKNASRSKLSDKPAEPAMIETEFDFPAPPLHRSQQPVSRAPEQTPPLSPSSLDLALQSHRLSTGHDSVSIRSSTSLGSAILAGRRGSATSSINDGSSGRFMAVTRQEEMLLAALRMKRARMREDIIAEFEEMDREDHHQLKREVTNESTSTNGGISRQSSRGNTRLETGALGARPRQSSAKERDDLVHESTSELGSDLEHFLRYGDTLSPGDCGRMRSRSNSAASQKSAGGRQRASLTTAAGPRSRPQRRDGSLPRRGSEQVSPKGQKEHHPHQILEDLAEDEEADVPRPDSPISPSDFPAPVSMANKKQVRLSAVGYYKPNIEAGWWNDSG